MSEFGKNVFSIDTRVLFCKYCETKVDSERRSSVIQHLKTEKHLRSVKRKEDQKETKCKQLLTNDLSFKKSKFNLNLCKAMVSANIPLNKLSNVEFRPFLEDCSGKDIPTESVLRKFYLDDCNNEIMEKIRRRVFNRKIWVSLDETTDAEGRFIANVIIGTSEEDTAGPIFLLNTEELEKINHSTVSKLFDKSLGILWPDGIRHDDVLLFLSDAAPYMIKCGKSLNALYSKMVHVTCAAHGLHRVSEEVRNQFSTVDKIVANVKNIFKKAPSRVQIFKNYAPEIPLPPEPIITRWGTWINAVLYYCKYYDKIRDVINMLDSNDALSIKVSKKNLVKEHVQNNLVYITSNFKVLSESILKLQTKNMPLAESLSIVDNVQTQLKSVQGEPAGKKVYEKMENVLSKNIGLKTLKQISSTLSGSISTMDGLPEDLTTNDLIFYKYAPITSVDVERSFSAYKNLLSHNRRSFKLENIKKHLIIQCNSGNYKL